MTQYQAIEQLYNEAEAYYMEKSELYADRWLSGNIPGVEKMTAYKRMLLIMCAESNYDLVDKYVKMTDYEIMAEKLPNIN